MKNKLVIIPLFLLATSLAIYGVVKFRKAMMFEEMVENEGGEGMEAAKRMAYELKMLADPNTGKIPDNIWFLERDFAKNLPKAETFYKDEPFAVRGPWNVGGRTRAVAIDMYNENIILAGGVSGGLWRSTDVGQSWTRVTPLNFHPGVNSIVQDKRSGHEGTWYYSSGEIIGTSASGGGSFYLGDGLFKSTDNGITWLPLTATAGGSANAFSTSWQGTWNVKVDNSNQVQDVVYAAIYGGVCKSLDGGNTWAWKLGSSTANVYYTDIAVSSTGTVYATMSDDAGASKGLWRSADGNSFVNITPDSFPTQFDLVTLAINPSNENEVYFLSVNKDSSGQESTNFYAEKEWTSLWKYNYLSGNGDSTGGQWTDLSANIPHGLGQFDNFNSQGGYNLIVDVHPTDPNTVFIGGTNLYRSTDGFTTSSNTTQIGGYMPGTTLPFYEIYPTHHPDQHRLAFFPSNPNRMLSASDGGVNICEDVMNSTVEWVSLNRGYRTSQFYTIGVDRGTTNSNVLLGGLQDNGSFFTSSTDATQPWSQPGFGDGAYCHVTTGADIVYTARQEGKTGKMQIDANGNVLAFRRIDPAADSAKDYQFISPFVVDLNDENIMYFAKGNKIWRNKVLNTIPLDGGWDSISTGWEMIDSLPVAGLAITCMAISKSPANILYVGTDNRNIYKMTNANTANPTLIDVTDKTGTVKFPTSNSNTSPYVSCIAINPDDANKVLAVFSNYGIYSLFYNIDGGSEWAKCAGNLEQGASGTGNGPSCRWAEVLNVADGTIFLLGTSVGLYATNFLNTSTSSSMDTVTQWVKQAEDVIGDVVIPMIQCRQSDGFTAIATHANGVYTTHYTSINETGAPTVSGITDLNANSALIMNVYPNPTNGAETHLSITAAKEGKASITIFNSAGTKVMTVLDGNLDRGKNNLIFSTAQLPKGVYFIKMELSNNSKVKRLVVM